MKSIGIKNVVNIPEISIPEILSKAINITANYEITEHEADLFSKALFMVAKELNKDGVSPKYLNIIFTKDFSYEFFCNIESAKGLLQNIILYSIERMRKQRFDDIHIMAVYIEELCHHFWNIEDELLVKHKIVQIFHGVGIDIKYNFSI